MKCLILAAGYATRLYPLTENFPKPLLDIRGKAILDWLIDDLSATHRIDSYVVISNHKYAHHFETWAGDRAEKIVVVDDGTTANDNRLGAVKDIQFAIDTLSINDDILVVAGDNVLDFSLGKFLEYAEEKKASCVMRYFEPVAERLQKCGVLEINGEEQILNMTEKPKCPASNWCCPPFYYYTQEDAGRIGEAIREGCHTDAPGSFVAWLCQKARVYAMEMPGKRYDIGDLRNYEKVKEEYRGINKC